MTSQPDRGHLDEDIQRENAERMAREKLPVDQGNLPGSAVKGLDDAQQSPVAAKHPQQNAQMKP